MPAGAWPQNILRFHVLFPEPMDGWRALDHIRLARGDGSHIEGALVDLPDGLWSADRRVLTVLFHPARLKSGLAARRTLGPALRVGETVRVLVGPGLLTDAGDPVGPVSFSVEVAPPAAAALDLRDWRGGPGRLLLSGAAPMDYMSASAHIRVLDQQGRRVRTSINPAAGGALELRWAVGAAACLQVDDRLEDVCGNRLTAAFEVVRGERGSNRSGDPEGGESGDGVAHYPL